MAYGILGQGQALKSGALGTFSNLSRQEQYRNAQNDAMEEAAETQDKSMIGTGAGMGLQYGMRDGNAITGALNQYAAQQGYTEAGSHLGASALSSLEGAQTVGSAYSATASQGAGALGSAAASMPEAAIAAEGAAGAASTGAGMAGTSAAASTASAAAGAAGAGSATATGATAGSWAGPIGMLAGAAIGGLIASVF